jgi:hypothetical protein
MPSPNIETPDWRRDMATILEELNEDVVVVDDQLRVIFPIHKRVYRYPSGETSHKPTSGPRR